MKHSKLTCLQLQILFFVRDHGRVRSLLKMTAGIGIDYKCAWFALQVLEQNGLVNVERRRGYPLVITSPARDCRERAESHNPDGYKGIVFQKS